MAANSAAGALTAIALFLGAGLGLTLCLPGFSKTALARRLAFGYLLGVSWVGLFLFAASHCLGMPLDAPLVFSACFIPLLAGAAVAIRLLAARRWIVPAGMPPRGPAQTVGWMVLSVLVILVSCAVLGNALTHPLEDWDGRMTWSVQAKFIRDSGSVDAEVLRSPKAFVSHPRYPLLMPLVQVAALEATGSEDERVFRAVYAVFFPVLVLLVIDAGRQWAGGRAALLSTFTLLTIPWIPFFRDGGATGAYSDLPLSCFLGGGLLLLIQSRPKISDGLAAGLLLSAAMLSKNEGLPEAAAILASAVGISVAAFRKRSRSAKVRLLAATVGIGLVLGCFLLLATWRSSIPNRYDESFFERLSVASLIGGFVSPRQISTLPVIASRMLSCEDWGLFWWLAPVVFLSAFPSARRPPTIAMAVAAAVPLLLAWCAYSQVHTAARYYAEVTWNRILLQAAVPIFYLFALAIRRLLHMTSS